MLPSIYANLLNVRNYSEMTYNLRDVSEFIIPFGRTNLRKASFAIVGPNIWESIPLEIRYQESLSQFKKILRLFFLDSY